MSKPFTLTSADGEKIHVKAGEYYFNTKARARRMMLNSLTPESRRVYSCLELATMGFQRELAVIMEKRGKIRPLTPLDIRDQTGLSKQHVRRAIVELEEQGLCERRGMDGGPLLKGRVALYSWAVPRPAKVENGSQRAAPIPEWFPEPWKPFLPLLKRLKIKLPLEMVVARDSLEEGEAVARAYQEAEMGAARFLKGVCAAPENGAHRERTERTGERRSSSAVSPVVTTGINRKPDDDDFPPTFASFKALYPRHRFNQNKARPLFAKLPAAEKKACLTRLRVYLACERWLDKKGKWVPLASNWLGSYHDDPPPLLVPTDAKTEATKNRIDQTVMAAKLLRSRGAGGAQ